MEEPLTVESWRQAIAAVRHLDLDEPVRVPKAAEPALPAGLPLRRSNVPWSVHKGATNVYREDVPGEHLQIREYRDHWTVQRDSHNPHYRPARHLALDTGDYTLDAVSNPLLTATGLALFGPIRGVQFVESVSSEALGAYLSLLDRGVGLARAGLST